MLHRFFMHTAITFPTSVNFSSFNNVACIYCSNVVKITNKSSNTKFNRRNTISNVYMNALMTNEDSGDSDQGIPNG